MAAADRSADLLGKVVQRFPFDRISSQGSIVALLRLLVSLELLGRYISYYNAGIILYLLVVVLWYNKY